MFQKSSFGWFKYFDYVILDLLALTVAFFGAYWIRHGWQNPLISDDYLMLLIVFLLLDLLLLICFDPLRNLNRRGYYKEFVVIGKHTLLLMMALFTWIYAVQKGGVYSRIALFAMGILYWLISYFFRICWKRISISSRRRKQPSLLIITEENMASFFSDRMQRNNFKEYQIRGVILIDGNRQTENFCGLPVAAAIEDVLTYVSRNWVDEVLIAFNTAALFPSEWITALVNMGVAVHLDLQFPAEEMACRYTGGEVGGNPVTTLSLNVMSPGKTVLKRGIDIAGGLFGCVLTVFLYILLAPWILIASPGPLIFRQRRIGINGKPFTMYKFRSMYPDAEERKKELMAQNKMDGLMFKMDFDPRVIGNKIVDGEERTGIGDFIRRHSLDEFPQFFNVLKGDMSLVGTRPPTPEEFKQYKASHRTRLSMLPGITGLWQVSGRNDITDFEEIVRLDTEYIKNWNFGKDIKIMLKTVGMIFKPKGSA